MSGEYIDGPQPDFPDSADEIAAHVHDSLLNYSQSRVREEVLHDSRAESESFRLVSLVESSDDRFGYALALSESARMGDIGDLSASLIYFTVDREAKQVVGEPRTVETSAILGGPNFTDDEAELRLQAITEQFDRDDLARILRLLNKASRMYLDPENAPNFMDARVRYALMESHLGELALLYEDGVTPAETKPGADPLKEPAFIKAATDALQKNGEKIATEGAVYFQATVSGELHALALHAYNKDLHISEAVRLGNNPTLNYCHYNAQTSNVEDDESYDNRSEKIPSALLIAILESNTQISENLFQSYVKEYYETL